MSNQPTLVFIHGSWHQANCYDKITAPLQKDHQFRTVSVSLPSTCNNPAATYKDDIDAAREVISHETAQGRDVVVIAHSYGGMVGNSVIKGFAKQKLQGAGAAIDGQPADQAPDSGSQGHVIGLILIASGFPLAGLAFMDPLFGRPPPSWRINNDTGYAELIVSPQKFFYHDLPADEADYWASQLTSQSLKALFEGGEHTYPGWMDVPVWYIGTIEDVGLPVVVQRMVVGMAREMGAHVEHRELQTSHSPFLSQPAEVVAIIVDAVAAFAGEVDHKDSALAGGATRVVMPSPKLWQPLTWYKFGLPLTFGHILGRCVLVFGWARSLFRSR